ncbi:putative D,D-dipeptide transport ATP-binding protein DdpD [Marinomonas gallaica]|uniref:D,D-dipeptide transport ATP-binding protein DdpD n=1 Tax=Marinomonas gallaica TaxID=1806667 RepID=A0A1C3JQS1_9GAMM|nr:ABC transporter ATP-binding protein [Marinomonas gallaica]SBT17578.1 putative D,D-dipeptide transport ATP-binding protein DdpD [Marinomonas gallaica]SBT19904.1 putative D,D-dipeptide transport ATP-binding protein DdpD [Marinomonas gallaica]
MSAIPVDSKCVLEVRNLSLSLDQQTLVDDISFSLYEGERVCLIGASGSGKSLTARAINGTLAPYIKVSGEVLVNGDSVAQQPVLARRAQARAATVFQDTYSALNPLMSVGKQLSLSTNIQSRDELLALLKQMQLKDAESLLSRLPSELSGGQRQRLCIAFALLSGANLLVADEPTTALDVLSQQQVIKVLRQCCDDHVCAHSEHLHGSPLSLLFITHDISVAAQLCDRAIVMQDGKIVEQGPLQTLLSQPKHPYTQRLVQAAHRVHVDTCLPQQKAVNA